MNKTEQSTNIKATYQIVNSDIINYLYAFVQVYWVFILTSVNMTPFQIATSLTIKSVLVFIVSILYGKFRNIIHVSNKMFKNVIPLAIMEIISLLLLSLSLYLHNSMLVVVLLVTQQLIYNIKRMEYDMNLVTLNKSLPVGNIFLKKQIKVETGWGISILVIGLLVTYLNSFGIQSYNVMAIIMILAAIICFINLLFIMKISSKYIGIYLPTDTIEPKQFEMKSNTNNKLTHTGIMAIILITLIYAICTSHDSTTTDILNTTIPNAEQIFGYMTAIGCICAITFITILRHIAEKIQSEYNKKKYYLILLFIIVLILSIYYIALISIEMTVLPLIILTILGSTVSIVYGNLIPIITTFNPNISNAMVISVSSVSVSIATTISPYLIYYSLISNRVLFSISIIITIFIILVLFIMIHRNKNNHL